jgi:hypothetical protein
MTITPNDLRSLADDAERQGSSLCAWKLRLAAVEGLLTSAFMAGRRSGRTQ